MWKTLEYWTVMGEVDISVCHTEGCEQKMLLEHHPKGGISMNMSARALTFLY